METIKSEEEIYLPRSQILLFPPSSHKALVGPPRTWWRLGISFHSVPPSSQMPSRLSQYVLLLLPPTCADF